jgi:chromate transporter
VLGAFIRLGCTSFGGPVAHLGYFRTEFVGRRGWLDEEQYADLVALCQFLPGPASSQVGFALGLLRAGAWGGLAAWTGFTLPSAALMVALALGAGRLNDSPVGAGVVHGLKLVAVAVVAQAVLGMARTLCPDARRATIAVVAITLVALLPITIGQLAAIAVGVMAGVAFCRNGATLAGGAGLLGVSRRAGGVCLSIYILLLVTLPLAQGVPGVEAFWAFFRAGALVFGGGHVVLPLLQDAVVTPGWVSQGSFLAGYGGAQALPGPLFSIAAYLGTLMQPGALALVSALVAIVATFLPGLLLVAGVLPFWHGMMRGTRMQAGVRGANAAVVGLLGSALYDPVWLGSVKAPIDVAIAAAGFVLLTSWRCSPLLVTGLTVLAALLSQS